MDDRTFNYKVGKAVNLHQAGRYALAERHYLRLLEVRHGNADVLHLLGTLKLQLGAAQDAFNCLDKAIKTAEKPPGIWYRRRGLALLRLGKPAEALQDFKAELATGGDSQTWRSIADAHQAMSQPVEAANAMRKCVTLDPKNSLSWSDLGFAYQMIGRYSDAAHCHQEALALNPRNVPSMLGKGQVLQQLCQIPEALASYEQLIALVPELSFVRSHRLVAMNYLEPSAVALAQAHRDFGASLGPPIRQLARRKPAKVGILSPDLRSHSCAYFLEPLLQLKPVDLQVNLYYDHTVGDSVTSRLAKLTGHMANTAALSNADLEAMLLHDELDVLIDLAGHFTRNRLEIFAHRVAPVQVTYLGYPNTTGVQAMDYRLADPKVDCFAGVADHFTEKLAYCQAGLWAYKPVPGAPAPGPKPAKPKFGYFGMLSKLGPQCLEAWAKSVNQTQVPLLIKGDGLEFPHLQAYWRGKLTAAGFQQDLVELRPKTGNTLDHLKMYEEVTVALDPWPYNGTTTVCEALWQGVPTVALRGDRHASNVAAGLLDWASLGHLAAGSIGEYTTRAESALQLARLTREELGSAGWLQHDKVAADFWRTLLTLGC